MINPEVASYLGLAQRARALVTGDTLIDAIRKKKAYLVVIALDASSKRIKTLTDKCTSYQVPMMMVPHALDLSNAIGKEYVVAVGVTNQGIATQIVNKKEVSHE